MSSIAPGPNSPISMPPAPSATPTPAAGVVSHLPDRIPEIPRAESTAPAEKPVTPDALQEQIDRVLAEASTSLRFRVDEQAQRVVVSVLDGAGEVVMQIPDEAALAVARHFARHGTLLAEKA